MSVCVCGAVLGSDECGTRAHLRGPRTVAEEVAANRNRAGRLREHPCPCGAGVGADCFDSEGNPVPWVHEGRVYQ